MPDERAPIDWRSHLIDIVKAMIPIIIIGAFGLYVAMEKLQVQNDANKAYYAEKFDQMEKGQTNLTKWMSYINDKLDRHTEKGK